MIKDHIATSATMEMDDFEYAPFYEKGGTLRIIKLFGDNLESMLKELNEVCNMTEVQAIMKGLH